MTSARSKTPELIVESKAALRQRLVTIAPLLGVDLDRSALTSTMVSELAEAANSSKDPRHSWALHVALTGRFPTPEDVASLARGLDLATPGTRMFAALESVLTSRAATTNDGALRQLTVVHDEVVVDVNFCAKHEHNTGIQRVVRETVPRWVDADRPLRLVAWTDDLSAMRELTPLERERVLEWNDRPPKGTNSGVVEQPEVIILPWGGTVVIPEVPLLALCRPLAAIAQFSGNRLAVVGYDAIPLVSADFVREAESERFAIYLATIKHADVVAAISETAAVEFGGFVSVLGSQGIEGPRVEAVVLPAESASREHAPEPAGDELPLVVCVGSHEPRKNQEAVLHAAEVLYAEGLRFRMVFIGNGDRSAMYRFDARVRSLRKRGLPVETHRGIADRALWEFMSSARFSVFVSLHEGYGLPVAESLSFGTPVLTSNFGSLAEIASTGGCVQVDPRSDGAIIDAMRALVTDDALIDRLRSEIVQRPSRTWDDYASELWNVTVEGGSR